MMPLGIPKVPYRMPGSQQADWVDIYNRMYRERIIFLGETIDDQIVNQIIAVMLFADSEARTRLRVPRWWRDSLGRLGSRGLGPRRTCAPEGARQPCRPQCKHTVRAPAPVWSGSSGAAD